jgi:hypothetical protein
MKMFGLNAPPKPPEMPRQPSEVPVFHTAQNDMWACRTHDSIGVRGRGRARTVYLINKEAIPKLIAAAGEWDDLCIEIMDDNMPSVKILAVMRELMQVDPYWDQVPYRQPTQEYVAQQLRDYIAWYVKNHGEPRRPVRLTNAAGETEIIKDPEKPRVPETQPDRPKKSDKAKAS